MFWKKIVWKCHHNMIYRNPWFGKGFIGKVESGKKKQWSAAGDVNHKKWQCKAVESIPKKQRMLKVDQSKVDHVLQQKTDARYIQSTTCRDGTSNATLLGTRLFLATRRVVSSETVWNGLHNSELYARKLMVCILLNSSNCAEQKSWVNEHED